MPLPHAFPDQRVNELLSLQELLANRRLSGAAQDAWVWSGPSFTAQASYRVLQDQENSEDPLILQRCRLVWKHRLPLKIKVFAWLLLRRRLMTRSRLQRMASDCALGQWTIANTYSSPAPSPKQCDRRRASIVSWRPQRRHSGGPSVAEHFVAKSSERLFLPQFGPSESIGTRSYSRVVPHPLMLFCTPRGGLRSFGTEVV